MKNYRERILQIYVRKDFDPSTARALALTAGYTRIERDESGNRITVGNVSPLATDVLQLPAEAGVELRELIEKYKGGKP